MDATYLQRFLSDSARKATRSEIRELLKLLARPDVISLAGGLPAPDTFPTEELAELAPSLFREHGRNALQYCATEGDAGLRDELIKLMAADGVDGRWAVAMCLAAARSVKSGAVMAIEES